MTTRGIIFDCDGTLVDGEYAHFASWRDALQKRGIFWEEQSHYPLCGHPGLELAKIFCARFDLDSPEALLEDKRRCYQALHKQGIPLIERTARFVRLLAQHKERFDLKLAVASGARKEEIMRHLENYQLTPYFDAVVSGVEDLRHIQDPTGVNKPQPYVYLHAAKLLGLSPAQCIAFEDSTPGLLSAVRAGILTVAVPNKFSRDHDFSLAALRIAPEEEIDLHQILGLLTTAAAAHRPI